MLEGAPDQAISLDHVAVLDSAENVVDARRQNGWINAKENVPAIRKYSKRSSVASSALLNVRNGPARTKTQTLREWFRDRNPVRLSTCPEFLLIHLRFDMPAASSAKGRAVWLNPDPNLSLRLGPSLLSASFRLRERPHRA